MGTQVEQKVTPDPGTLRARSGVWNAFSAPTGEIPHICIHRDTVFSSTSPVCPGDTVTQFYSAGCVSEG